MNNKRYFTPTNGDEQVERYVISGDSGSTGQHIKITTIESGSGTIQNNIEDRYNLRTEEIIPEEEGETQ
jgi:hypothetical protein